MEEKMRKKIYKYYLVRSKFGKRTQGAFPLSEEGKDWAEGYAEELEKKTGEKFEVIKG
jgi:hypothetical protein